MFSFVILHYKNIDETLNCLDKLKVFKDKAHFIVVDNNSLNDKEIKEIKEYTDDILLLDKNYGFAKANNKGIKYAKDKYNSKYYIVINNDVEITDEDFLNKILKDYKKYEFDMLGGYIESPLYSVNPYKPLKNIDEVNSEINKSKIIIKICSSSFLYRLLMLGIRVKRLFKKPLKPVNGISLEEKVALHGCAIIFSEKYINKYKYPFFNDTFLFHEEDFLYQRIIKDNLVSIYDPSIKVFHREGSTMSKVTKNERFKRKFREEERIKSLELLLKEI